MLKLQSKKVSLHLPDKLYANQALPAVSLGVNIVNVKRVACSSANKVRVLFQIFNIRIPSPKEDEKPADKQAVAKLHCRKKGNWKRERERERAAFSIPSKNSLGDHTLKRYTAYMTVFGAAKRDKPWQRFPNSVNATNPST